ncbi:succinylglutamate desuccinylase/aspartoacylase family protein [Ideonella sp. A 288]|uniref:succinylglutamate desuccinylase/aspartoacylase domain-containing protein n=1 Tax=Ideonella sp. A 288 TaxID=1962181 RepID=UPI000B4B614D|nr:succinylglutamate desuccinylase/aspartoacylase family protein [Ideonella sp. A 288]
MPSTDTAQAPAPLPPFKSVRYAGRAPGPRLIVTGAVHGNETCGTRGIERVMADLDSGRLVLQAGSVTFVPITNAKAYVLGRRAGDRNLNRALQPTAEPREFEDHVANWLCPLLAEHEVLLDLHSFQSPGRAFVMVGPRDNTGPLEPFAHAADEEALARRLGVGRAVDGWLDTYATGVARRRAAAEAEGRSGTLDLHPRYGVGTTEYMRSQGGWALTLECGQNDDPQSPEVAYAAIRQTLAHLGLTAEAPPPVVSPMEALSLVDVIDKVHNDDAFARPWQSFDALRAGDLIGTRANGEAVHAPHDGWIVFPNPRSEARQEWFYLARASGRF